MKHEQSLDRRMARVESLARWWTSASQKARFDILKTSIQANTPPFSDLRYAIILAETEAGEVGEG
ncbi:MAG TPA: hypothetical protein VFI89_09840 [Burkholderiales bacterium]|nr:hypothetical protein [Burkholderiales bacterium]